MSVVAAFAFGLPALAQSEPTYISSMSPYQVRALSGTYVPTNGRSTIESVTPSEWLTSDPGNGLGGIILAWSGGFKATGGTKLYVTGGGHNDSANNGVYVFDFSGTTRPVGWTLPSISAVSSVRNNSNLYADGRSTSVHTYDGTVYASHNNHVYRFGGAPYSTSGGFTSGAAKYNIATNTWSSAPSCPAAPNAPSTIYDPGSGKIVVGMAGQLAAAFYRTSNDTWSALKSVSVYWGSSCGAYDPTRSRGVLVGNGENRLVTIDWSGETLTTASLPASGATSILGETISCFYDGGRDVYWVFGGDTTSSGWTNLYEMSASSFSITAHALTGDAIQRMSGMIGSYGRFVFMDSWRAIGLVAATDSPAYVIRLPDGTTAPTVPPAPILRAD